LWEKKRAQLERKEHKIKDELENASSDFESQVKRIAAIAVISGGVAWLGYKTFKAITADKKEEKQIKEEPQSETRTSTPASKASFFSWKSIILERLVTAAVKVITSQIASLLASKVDDAISEDSD